jgi:muramoyltetrapeptide carboxypeptidase LdcA involved in peptidoglycan recycling
MFQKEHRLSAYSKGIFRKFLVEKLIIRGTHYIVKTKKELNNIPIIANADFGHTTPIFTFPIGGKVKIEATLNSATIEILEG